MRSYRLIAGFALIALLGAGCDWSSLPLVGRFASPVSTSTISFGSTPIDAAKAIQFLPGDTFEVRQTVFGFGAFLPDLLGSKDGVRMVTVTRFAPSNFANVSWTVTSEKETDASIKARQAYEKDVEQNPRAIGEKVAVPPVPQMERVTASGTVMDASLKTPHSAYLPAYWSPGVNNLMNEKSAIWLSEDAFMELVRTRHTILNLGIFDSEANQAARNITDLKGALDRLRKQANEDGKFKDLTLLEAEPDFIEYPLEVNGRTVTVSAIKAKNWFGEVIVLNSAQNPMILKVTMNPLASSASDALGGNIALLDKLYGYEISNIQLRR
ncbi:hypothetical protein K8R04_01695 [Candidatus Uhrbacteria bacterium]|nr:hypothetical protein [Candidatus Uhrbacteria bacterium]